MRADNPCLDVLLHISSTVEATPSKSDLSRMSFVETGPGPDVFWVVRQASSVECEKRFMYHLASQRHSGPLLRKSPPGIQLSQC